MGCLAFLFLHALKGLSSPYDTATVCLLLSLDTHLWFRLWLWRQTRR